MTGSGVGYDPVIKGNRYTFGVSGKLYKFNLLLYDRQTDSLWSQILRKAVTGPMAGQQLKAFPILETSWSEWKRKHPDTLVLSLNTGYQRNYESDPYGTQADRVLGVTVGGKAKGYPFSELVKVDSPIPDRIGKTRVLIHFDPESQSAWATDLDNNPLEAFVTYLQAWKDFYPRSRLYKRH